MSTVEAVRALGGSAVELEVDVLVNNAAATRFSWASHFARPTAGRVVKDGKGFRPCGRFSTQS